MRVLFISYNGAQEPIFQSQGISYLQGLSKTKKVKFILLTFEKSLSDREGIKHLDDTLKQYQIEWYRLLYHKSPFLLMKLFDIAVGMIYCSFLILSKKIEIVHARSYMPAIMAFTLARIFKVKLIFDMRGVLPDEYVDGGMIKKNGIIYKTMKILEKRLLLASDCTVVLTHKIKGVIDNFYYPKIKKRLYLETIPCCVDLAKFSPLAKKKEFSIKLGLNNKFIFLYCGSVGTWYLFEEIVDFFLVAKEKIPDAHLLILSQSDKNFIKQTVLNKNLRGEDFTISEVPHRIIPDYIAISKAGIVFYKPTFARLAGSPIKFAEYLACGVPVIINSGVGDTEEIVNSNNIGVVINKFLPEYYAQAIDRLLEILKDKEILTQRCRKTAEMFFSLDDGVDKYWNIYKNLSKRQVSN